MSTPATTTADFVLSAELVSHTQDVRAVSAVGQTQPSSTSTTTEMKVATSSRDQTVKLWNAVNGQLLHTFLGHQHFVGSLLYLETSPHFPSPCIVSGGNDKLINLWNIENGALLLTLIGHQETVCALGVTVQGELISGSWDKTARIWRGPEHYTTLQGHAHSVWAVLGLPNGDVITGSADHSIKIWRSGQCVSTLNRHKDCVRGLAHVPGVGFLSCGNDGLIVLWSYSGDCLQELLGHESFIYTLSTLPSGEYVSGGEDRTVKIWRGGECVQTIKHPGSVWSVASLPNGELLTGCSDGVARIWTRDIHRIASESVIQAYDKSVSVQVLPGGNETVGGISLDKIPGLDALQLPGSRDGENKVVRNGNTAEAYQWSSVEAQWNKVGEVVTQPTGGESMDKQYDYVFDVDIGDGQIRKLGYNNHENPYMVAQEFLLREELDKGWLDTVAQFIVKNSKPITIGESSQTFADPFTGGQRYIPADAQQSTVPTPVKRPTHFPLNSAVLFDTANHTAILSKVVELNNELIKQQEKLAMDKNEEALLTNIIKIVADTSRYHLSSFSEAELQLLLKLLQWPSNVVFPILDIARLVILHPVGAQKFASSTAVVSLISTNLETSKPAANQMLATRFLVNMFKWEASRVIIANRWQEILDKIADLARTENKHLRLAVVTLILNVSSLFVNTPNADGKMQCMSILSEILAQCTEQEAEVVYRAFVAVGTLAFNDIECSRLIRDLDILQHLENSKLHAQPKIAECAKEIKLFVLSL